MKSLRLIHTYPGLAFAPLLVFFIFTGLLQTFDLHESKKDGSYHAPAWAVAAGSVHMHQRLPVVDRKNAPSRTTMRVLIALTCVGLLTTVSLGVVMAWKLQKQKTGLLISIIAGAALPIIILTLQNRGH